MTSYFQQSICISPDVEQFDEWFNARFPANRLSKAQRSNRAYKRKMALAGWMAARNIPAPPPAKNSLTRVYFKGLTPDDFMAARDTAELTPQDWRESYIRAGLHKP